MSLQNLKLRFTSTDQYGSLKFISTTNICQETHEKLRKVKTILEKHYPEAYQPLYQKTDSKVISVRTNRTPYRFETDEVYEVTIKAVERQKIKDNSAYVVLKIADHPNHIKNQNETVIDLLKLE
jgi:hypothetical protein